MFEIMPYHYDQNLFRLFDQMLDLPNQMGQIRTDIIDEGENYLLLAELPGFKKEDIKIEIYENYLIIMANHKRKNEVHENNFIRRERIYGSFCRRFEISDTDKDRITASYQNGILSIRLSKTNPAYKEASKRVDIQ